MSEHEETKRGDDEGAEEEPEDVEDEVKEAKSSDADPGEEGQSDAPSVSGSPCQLITGARVLAATR